MTTVIRSYPAAKSKVCVSAIQWLPGSLSATLPLFAVNQKMSPNTLFLRADDPNIYGVSSGHLSQVPTIEKNTITKPGNKGCNFYSAPWCISTHPAMDTGKRIEIKAIDESVYRYITQLYSLIGSKPINLGNWKLEQNGYVKIYQLLQGSSYTNINGTAYFGASGDLNTSIAGVANTTEIASYLISNDFQYNGEIIITYQMAYNTFCAVDSPITISAIDLNNPANGRIFFTLLNNVGVYNGYS
jgi:hypothetical protein